MKQRASILSSALFLSVVLASNVYGQGTLVRDCSGQVFRSERQGLQCDKWIIEWRDPNGKTWGMTMGKSRESVIKQRDERISFNKIYAKWAGTRPDPNYDNPSEPLCDVCEHNSGNRRWSPQEREAWEIVHKIYEEWARKAERAIQTLIKTDGRLAKSANNPFRHVGGVLRDYTRALKEAQQKLLTLQNQLTLTEQTAKGIIGNIDSMSNEVSDRSEERRVGK